MKAEDIIEGLNRHIESVRKREGISPKGHLVLQRVTETHPVFKVYKTYKIILWFVKDWKSYRIISMEHTVKATDTQETVMRDINAQLSTQIFDWIGTDSYKQVIQGDYEAVKV